LEHYIEHLKTSTLEFHQRNLCYPRTIWFSVKAPPKYGLLPHLRDKPQTR